MEKSVAIIRKVGNQYCVFSESGSKNLGCSDSLEGAQKRLQQVEYFKHKDKGSHMNYNEAFNKIGKTLSALDPKTVGQAPDSKPQEIEVKSETLSVGESRTLTVSEKLSRGTIAGTVSERVLDAKDHFPVITQTQAQSSMVRVLQLIDAPVWYAGSLTELRQAVYAGIMKLHPNMELNVRVSAEQAVALSDGQSPAQTTKTSIKDPNDVVKSQVPSASRPTLTSAQVAEALADAETRKVVGGRLMELLDQQVERIAEAKKVASRLLKSGLEADEFDELSTYIQESILSELLMRDNSSVGSVDRRRELLNRLGSKNE